VKRGGGEEADRNKATVSGKVNRDTVSGGGERDKDTVSGRPTEIMILCQGGRQR